MWATSNKVLSLVIIKKCKLPIAHTQWKTSNEEIAQLCGLPSREEKAT